jgi:MFS family permease
MTSPVDITSEPVHRQHYGLTFAVLAISGATYALLQALVAPALPEIQHDLHTTPTAVAWVLTAFLLSASIFTPILGRLGDMFGKERMLVAALVTLALGSLVAALALLAAVTGFCTGCEAYKLGCLLRGKPFVSCPIPGARA